MGTNYYLETARCSRCERCVRKHIGKKSAGWVFVLNTSENATLHDWLVDLTTPNVIIVNEYGDEILFGDFLEILFQPCKEDKHPRGEPYYEIFISTHKGEFC